MDKSNYHIEVEKWAKKNPAEFFQDDKPVYRGDFLFRCQQYDEASKTYLEKRLAMLPDAIKWYLQIFQGLMFAGLMTFSLALIYKTIDIMVNFSGCLQEWIALALISIYFVFIVIGIIHKPKNSGSPWLSDFIQKKFLIRTNLRELEMEMHYISKVLEDRFPDEK